MANFVLKFNLRSLTTKSITACLLVMLTVSGLSAQNSQNSATEPTRRTDHPNAFYNRGLRFNSSGNSNRAAFKPERDYPAPRGVLTFYPFALIGSHLMCGYEHSISRKVSLKGNFAYGVAENSDYYNLDKMKGISGEIQARYYPFATGLRGFYFGAFLLGKNMQGQYERSGYWNGQIWSTVTEKVNASASQFGFLTGYQGTLRGAVTYEFYIGGGLVNSNYEVDKNQLNYSGNIFGNQTIDSYTTGMQLHTGISIGFVTHTFREEQPPRR